MLSESDRTRCAPLVGLAGGDEGLMKRLPIDPTRCKNVGAVVSSVSGPASAFVMEGKSKTLSLALWVRRGRGAGREGIKVDDGLRSFNTS